MSKVDKDDYLNLYEYMEGLADTLDQMADATVDKFKEASSISLNFSDALLDVGELIRKAEDRIRRAL